ncbi:hypothetical protein ACIPC1_09430 [Streptomyces sp. NPDC087263]
MSRGTAGVPCTDWRPGGAPRVCAATVAMRPTAPLPLDDVSE